MTADRPERAEPGAVACGESCGVGRHAGCDRCAGTTRRDFMKVSGVALAALAGAGAAEAADGHGSDLDEDRMGVLIDLTVCVGCRRCEWACKQSHGRDAGALHEYDDQSVFEETRRPTPDSLTVVNRAGDDGEDCGGKGPVHLKIQCMHCEKPACVSACLVGAMRKDPKGPVHYDASRCIGCRYCMVACPFERLSYEYDKKLTPRVMKCDMCMDRTKDGGVPACVDICPVEALTFGRRADLLRTAHERIREHPERYVDHVYGEHEIGGTSFLYLSDRPFAELGFPTLSSHNPANTTEAIQHGIFAGFAAPIGLVALLGTLNAVTKKWRADR